MNTFDFIFVEYELGNKPLPKDYCSGIESKDLRRLYRKLFNVIHPAIQIHCVKLDGYRAITSFEAFRNKVRNFSKTRWYYAIGDKEEFSQFYAKNYVGFKEIQHNSIHEFFEFIGYNYKSKKFN